MPIGREAVMVAGLLPMAVFECASAAPAALVITTAFLFTAVALRGQLLGSWTAGEVSIAAASALVFCSQKPVYAPLLVLALPTLLTKSLRKHALVPQAVILAVALGGTALWIAFSWSGAILRYPNGISAADQTNFIVTHPLEYAETLGRSFWYLWSYYYDSMVGILGWLTLPLPMIVYVLATTAFILSVLVQPLDSPRLPACACVWNVFILSIGVVLMMTAVYLSWTSVGLPIIPGIQGRYFIPFLPLFIATVYSALRWYPFRQTLWLVDVLVVPTIIAADLLIADITIVRAFQIF